MINDKIKVIDEIQLGSTDYGFIYSHKELSRHKSYGDHYERNKLTFSIDYCAGSLDRYKGSFVLYQKGVMCGQSSDGELLFEKGIEHFGGSNLALFLVPENREDFDKAVREHAKGRF